MALTIIIIMMLISTMAKLTMVFTISRTIIIEKNPTHVISSLFKKKCEIVLLILLVMPKASCSH